MAKNKPAKNLYEVLELRVVDGEIVPHIKPLSPLAHHREFDKAVCASGLKVYTRPLMSGDADGTTDTLAPSFCSSVFVMELFQGARYREFRNAY